MELYTIAEADESSVSASDILAQTLIVGAVILTPSSFKRQRKSEQSPTKHLTEIGKGLQGVVFEHHDASLALKKEHPANASLPTNLQREYAAHVAVSAAFHRYRNSDLSKSRISVPRPHCIVGKQDEFWETNEARFPSEHGTREALVQMQRILPLPKRTRRALIARFLPPCNNTNTSNSSDSRDESIRTALADPYNKHCLVRTYLGRQTGTRSRETFSLRNFPLYLQSMLDFGLDVHGLAASMGTAFAIMHWGAGVNGDDVEFVLGTESLPTEFPPHSDLQRRAVGFYLLDFGQCDMLDLKSADSRTVYQSFKGAMVTGDNQLFIPNCLNNPELFKSFKQAYIHAADEILLDIDLVDRYNIRQFMSEYEEYAEDFL